MVMEIDANGRHMHRNVRCNHVNRNGFYRRQQYLNGAFNIKIGQTEVSLLGLKRESRTIKLPILGTKAKFIFFNFK